MFDFDSKTDEQLTAYAKETLGLDLSGDESREELIVMIEATLEDNPALDLPDPAAPQERSGVIGDEGENHD